MTCVFEQLCGRIIRQKVARDVCNLKFLTSSVSIS